MKDAIIKNSIIGLQQEGLRFSIDAVAKSLKISKKTIYKYFPAKEDLAVEIYKTFYENAINEIGKTENARSKVKCIKQTLKVYYQSHRMVREDIFNKYSLNANIRSLAQKNHESIKTHLEKLLPQTEKAALMVVIDGSLQNLCEKTEEEENVINLLVSLIC